MADAKICKIVCSDDTHLSCRFLLFYTTFYWQHKRIMSLYLLPFYNMRTKSCRTCFIYQVWINIIHDQCIGKWSNYFTGTNILFHRLPSWKWNFKSGTLEDGIPFYIYRILLYQGVSHQKKSFGYSFCYFSLITSGRTESIVQKVLGARSCYQPWFPRTVFQWTNETHTERYIYKCCKNSWVS